MKIPVAVLTAASLALLAACSKEPEPGPAQKAGKELDRAIERAGKQTQEAMDKAEARASKKVEEMGQAIERAGERLQERGSRQ